MTYEEIKRDLIALGSPEKAAMQQRFFKTGKGEYGEGDKFIGISMPEIRSVAKMLRSMELAEVYKLLRDEYHDCRMLALIVLIDRYKKGDNMLKEDIFNGYLANTEYINNWDLVDVTCPNIIGEHLKSRDRDVLYTLAASTDLWEQRIAIVSTLQLIRSGDFADTIELSKILLHHSHDLIHKAVGWMLREVGKRDISLLHSFLELYHKEMPRTMLRYAIEKLSSDERAYYMRKNN